MAWTYRVGFSVLLATCSAQGVLAQTAPVELPPIIVETPSPLPKPVRAPAETAAPDLALPPAGIIIADETFFPTTVLTGEQIDRQQSRSLGDVLFTKPGITSSTFAPLASRPIIRGLDNFRVRIQENGVGAADVSALSEDHGVPIDTLVTDQVEVVRGPATLRYGSPAIGGVVSATNNRIPEAVVPGVSVVTKGGYTSVDDGGEGAVLIDAGKDNVAVHADFFKRRGSDYETPRGIQENTDYDSQGGSLGTSFVGNRGYMGFAISRYESNYGIPGEEAVERDLRIDLEQTKFTSKGEFRPDASGIAAVKYWFGYTDYKHDEIATEDGVSGIGSTFIKKEYEARTEILHKPLLTSFGPLTGAVGFQYGNRDLSAAGEGGELLAPNDTISVAAYLFEELELTKRLKLQAAARIEKVEVDGATVEFPDLDFEDELGEDALFGVKREFTPVSGSIGLLYDLPAGVVFSLTGQYVERAPDALELLAKGPHEATETFEIGNPNLEKEKARTIEAGFKRAQGPFRFDTSAYYTVFDGFIFKSETGNFCEEGGGCNAADGLTQIVYSQRDATFYGAELAGELDVGRVWRGVWGVDAQYDFVKAEFEGGENVPRIPPHRLGGGVYYRDASFFARVGLLHAFEQDDVAELEDPTKGYNLLSAEINYTTKLAEQDGIKELSIGIKGENLLDDDVRNHVSFKKEDVLLPGQSVKLQMKMRLN